MSDQHRCDIDYLFLPPTPERLARMRAEYQADADYALHHPHEQARLTRTALLAALRTDRYTKTADLAQRTGASTDAVRTALHKAVQRGFPIERDPRTVQGGYRLRRTAS